MSITPEIRDVLESAARFLEFHAHPGGEAQYHANAINALLAAAAPKPAHRGLELLDRILQCGERPHRAVEREYAVQELRYLLTPTPAPLNECPVCKKMVPSRVHCMHCNAHMERDLWYKNIKPTPTPKPAPLAENLSVTVSDAIPANSMLIHSGGETTAVVNIAATPTPAPLPGEVEEAVAYLELDLKHVQATGDGVTFLNRIRTILSALADLQAQLASRDAEIAKLRRVAQAAHRYNDEDAPESMLRDALKEAGYE